MFHLSCLTLAVLASLPLDAPSNSGAPVPPATSAAAPTELVGPPAPPPPPDPCDLAQRVLDAGPEATEVVARLRQLGPQADAAIVIALPRERRKDVSIALLEAVRDGGTARADAAVRPYLFHYDPDVATAATWALAAIDGPRAAPTLEHVLAECRSFEQSLAALAALGALHLPASFPFLSRYAEDAKKDPILRAEAARLLPNMDTPKTRKWLKALQLPVGTNAFFAAEIDRLMTSLAPGTGDKRDHPFR